MGPRSRRARRLDRRAPTVDGAGAAGSLRRRPSHRIFANMSIDLRLDAQPVLEGDLAGHLAGVHAVADQPLGDHRAALAGQLELAVEVPVLIARQLLRIGEAEVEDAPAQE